MSLRMGSESYTPISRTNEVSCRYVSCSVLSSDVSYTDEEATSNSFPTTHFNGIPINEPEKQRRKICHQLYQPNSNKPEVSIKISVRELSQLRQAETTVCQAKSFTS